MTRNEIQNSLSDLCKTFSICQLCSSIFHPISYSLFFAKNTATARDFSWVPEELQITLFKKTRHYFIKYDKADELSDDDVVFVYQCYFLDKYKIPKPSW